MMAYLVQNIHPSGVKILQEANLKVRIGASLLEDDILEGAKGGEAIVIRSQGRLTRRIIEGCPSLRCIGRYGVGVDNIDIETANRLRIPIVYAPGVNSGAVAEHAIMLMLAISRKLPLLNRLMREGKWIELRGLQFDCLSEQVLGIVGVGTIGAEVARRARAFGMKTLGFDPCLSHEQLKEKEIIPADKEFLLRESDIVSLHLPLNADTTHFIGRREFGLMKAGVVLINTSRGAIVDEQALREALREGRVSAAGLDVFEEEPLRKDSPLLELENVVVTPHTAGLTRDTVRKLATIVCEGVVRVLRGELPENVFNKGMW